MEAKDFISIYAAILATVVFFWNVRASSPKIKVTLVPGCRGSNDNLETGVYLAIQNPSPHTVHVNSVLLLYPYQRVTFLQKIKHLCEFKRFSRYIGWVHNSMIFDGIATGLPASIESRNSHEIFIPEEKIWEMLKQGGAKIFAAEVQDALWRSKYSTAFEMYSRPGSSHRRRHDTQ